MRRIKEALKEKMKNMGIFLKIIILFEAVLIVTIIITSSYIIDRFSSTVIEKEILLGDKNLDKLVEYSNEKYNRIYNLYNYIHNDAIADIVADTVKNPDEGYKIENIKTVDVFMKGVAASDSDISDIIIISVSGVVYSYSGEGLSDVKPSFGFLKYEPFAEFLKSEDTIRCVYDTIPYTLKEREDVVSFTGKIFDPTLFPEKELAGIFIINVPVEKFANLNLNTGSSVEGKFLLTNDQNQILFSTNYGDWGEQNQFDEMEKEKYYVNNKDVGISGMRVVYMLPNRSLLDEIDQINQQIYKGMLLSILFTVSAGYVIYRVFNRQVQVLIQAMAQLQKGNFNLHIPVRSKDEIGIISEAFNEMCEKLNVYISEVYAAEIQRKNAELNALQLQIDPHFLYNTLDSIRTKALLENDEDTAEMIVLLGKLFRWNTATKGKFISLVDELEYIETYLQLQKYRYNELLEVDIQVPDEYLDYMVPKLILQPLVENVIKYAFVNKQGNGLIGISVRVKEESRMEITVYDNGIGMKEEILQEMCDKLNRQISQDEFESIGLQNVHTRIRLLFGEEYGLQIRSISGTGTAVKIALPVLEEKDVQEECINYLL